MAEHVGILGGTFDPIHIGHVVLALRAQEQLELDRVLLIPNVRSPFKAHAPIASFSDRLRMAQLAVVDLARIDVSDVEGARGGVSYMVDTLAVLTSAQPDARYTLILGYDALHDFPSWHSSDRILSMASLAAVARAGEPVSEAPVAATRIDMPRLDVSASDIRARIARGLSITCLTPQAVVDYIAEHHLYSSDAEPSSQAQS